MRTLAIIAVSACLATGTAALFSLPNHSALAQVPSSPALNAPSALANLVGQEIEISFRGSDDLSPPGYSGASMKWTSTTGKLLAIDQGWLTVQTNGGWDKAMPILHVPFASVAMILSIGEPSTTQPSRTAG